MDANLETNHAFLCGWRKLCVPGTVVEGAQPREHVFSGWFVLLDFGNHTAFGKTIPVFATAAQRRLCNGVGTFDRAVGKSGIPGVGLPEIALSLSWTDLLNLFFVVAAGVLIWDDAPRADRKTAY